MKNPDLAAVENDSLITALEDAQVWFGRGYCISRLYTPAETTNHKWTILLIREREEG